MRLPLTTLWILILAPIVTACQSTPHNNEPVNPDTVNKTAKAPAAYIDSTPVSKDELYAVLLEIGGGQALAELLLDRALSKRLTQEGLALSPADIQAEQDRLLNSLSEDRDQAVRLVKQMRADRGLGEQRYAALLGRNAGLRKLISDNIKVSEAAVRQAYALAYGKRYRVRLITAASAQTLTKVRRRALAGESFTELAIELSTDLSAQQGGLLSAFSPLDATYPKSIRDAAARLTTESEGKRISSIIALPQGYALIRLEEVVTPQGPPLEQIRARLESAVRLDLERIRMQQLARALIDQANVIVLDPELDKAWKRQRDTVLQR